MTLEAELSTAVGERHVLVDPSVTASFETDWTRRFSGRARCVVRPADTQQVSSVLRVCGSYGVAVVTQGGNTGLVGGGVPADGQVVLSTARLRHVGAVDPVAGQVTVGAGVTLTDLQQTVRPMGLDFGVDFAARDSATIGGLVATNAGGERVLRYGSTRQQVVGLEAVLADGSVLSRLEPLPKDNTGFDLVGLLTGSEGTLAVITAVRVRLWPLFTHRTVALLALDSTGAALAALASLKSSLGSLEAAELFLASGLTLVMGHTGLPAPIPGDHPVYLLVECADHVDTGEAMLEALEEVSALVPGLVDIVMGDDARGRAGLWRYREAHTESINACGVPVKLDVAIPHDQLERALNDLPGLVTKVAPGAQTIVFGHLNEGNLHINVLGAAADAEVVTDAVLQYVASLHGSISAEHGVGRAKTQWLGLTRSASEIAAMRSIKRALDPGELLNPGVIFPS
ncbi:MAG: FAD-binding oxidoreductase [Dermatophilaceae bacterium]